MLEGIVVGGWLVGFSIVVLAALMRSLPPFIRILYDAFVSIWHLLRMVTALFHRRRAH